MRRRSRRQLKGLSSDATAGVLLLAAGAGLAWWLWKKNTPPKSVAGLGCAGGGCYCGCGK